MEKAEIGVTRLPGSLIPRKKKIRPTMAPCRSGFAATAFSVFLISDFPSPLNISRINTDVVL